MIIGLPREIKNNENRAALTPVDAMSLVKAGNSVLIESGAGLWSGFRDESYQEVCSQ